MQNKLKAIIIIFFTLLLNILLSGCILDQFNIFGTSFNQKNINIEEHEGFPVLNINFEINDLVNLKTYDSNSELIDFDYFYNSGNAKLNLGSYRETLKQEEITFKVTDENNNEIKKLSYSFGLPSINIISCSQYIWEHDGLNSLVEIKVDLYNNGDSPVFPNKIKLYYNNLASSSYVLPRCILPLSYGSITSFIYIDDIVSADEFILEIYDTESYKLVEEELSFSNIDLVDTTIYTEGLDNYIEVPIPNALYDYYLNHDRYYIDDYTAFIFDRYDDLFIDLFVDILIENFDFSNYLELYTDVKKINEVGDFIQKIDYMKDKENGIEVEYPRFPIETLFYNDYKGGGDCEDKAILGASLLTNQVFGYNVSLIRIPDHMAVGVNLEKDAVPNHDYYIDNYYFLDTSPGPNDKPDLGYVHKDYENPSEIDVFTLNSKPIIDHNWDNGSLIIYNSSEGKKTIKVLVYISNLGNIKAENLELKGVFHIDDLDVYEKVIEISDILPYSKIKTILTIDVPSGFEYKFDTRVIMNDIAVSTQTSKNTISS